MTMKIFYRTLAAIMFIIFATISTFLVINTAINKGVTIASKQVDSTIAEINTLIGDNHFYDNIYFVNCFPKICAKASHFSYSQISKNKDEKPTLENKYELGTTGVVVAKINPFTGSININMPANNFVLLQNSEPLGSAFVKGLSFSYSNGFINYIKTLFGKQTGDNLEKSQYLSIKEPKFSYDDTRVKAELVEYKQNIYNKKDDTISFNDVLYLHGLTINADDIGLHLHYDIAFENFDLKSYKKITDLSFNNQLEKMLKADDYQEILSKNGMVYIYELFNAIQKAPKHNTKLLVNNFKLSEVDTADKDAKNYVIKANADLSLDEDMNAKGFLNIRIVNPNSAMVKIFSRAKAYDAENKKSIDVFVFNKDKNEYSLNAKLKGETLNINGQEINVDGKVKKALEGISFMVSMLAMQINK